MLFCFLSGSRRWVCVVESLYRGVNDSISHTDLLQWFPAWFEWMRIVGQVVMGESFLNDFGLLKWNTKVWFFLLVYEFRTPPPHSPLRTDIKIPRQLNNSLSPFQNDRVPGMENRYLVYYMSEKLTLMILWIAPRCDTHQQKTTLEKALQVIKN